MILLLKVLVMKVMKMTLLLKVMNNYFADECDEDGLIETATAEVKVSG